MMTRYGMLIDTTNCIGCYACRTACQRQNGLDADIDYIRYETRETGTMPNVRFETVPLQCMHCEDAPCVKVCPTQALKLPEGATEDNTIIGKAVIDEDTCLAFRLTGCRFCYDACIEARGEDKKAIELDENNRPHVTADLCNGCGACESVCVSLQNGSISSGARERAIVIRPLEAIEG